MSAVASIAHRELLTPKIDRIEVTSGSSLIFAPDWQPIVWNHADRAKGQAWGNPTVASFQTYGTPHVS